MAWDWSWLAFGLGVCAGVAGLWLAALLGATDRAADDERRERERW